MKIQKWINWLLLSSQISTGIEKFYCYLKFLVNLQKYIGPKFAGKNGSTICPYFKPFGFSSLNIFWKGCVINDKSFIVTVIP
jgi:hypothetical protein